MPVRKAFPPGMRQIPGAILHAGAAGPCVRFLLVSARKWKAPPEPIPCPSSSLSPGPWAHRGTMSPRRPFKNAASAGWFGSARRNRPGSRRRHRQKSSRFLTRTTPPGTASGRPPAISIRRIFLRPRDKQLPNDVTILTYAAILTCVPLMLLVSSAASPQVNHYGKCFLRDYLEIRVILQ